MWHGKFGYNLIGGVFQNQEKRDVDALLFSFFSYRLPVYRMRCCQNQIGIASTFSVWREIIHLDKWHIIIINIMYCKLHT